MTQKAAPAPVPVQGGHVARCWAVTGAVGGSGATTLAIEFANQLCARQAKPKSVCLIDLNLADGSAAAYLGSTPAMRLGDLAAAAARPGRGHAAGLRHPGDRRSSTSSPPGATPRPSTPCPAKRSCGCWRSPASATTG
jgi:Flp pilus assembly protein, ATPase CpaE